MILEKNVVLSRPDKKPILYDVSYIPNQSPKPIIIFCHGYKGYKDWGAWSLVAKAFAREGYFFLKFNFSHNGSTVEQPIDFPDLKAFGQNNFSKELNDLDSIISLVSSNKVFEKEIDIKSLSLIGHSRGGGIVLIKAEENPMISRVITWAGICDFKVRFQEGSETFNLWKKTGITFVENGRTKQQMPHEFQFYEDFKTNEKRLTIKRAVENLNSQQLIIHGSEDTSVTIIEGQKLHQWNPKSSFKIIENADHVFGANHPWDNVNLPADLSKVVELTIAFIKKKTV